MKKASTLLLFLLCYTFCLSQADLNRGLVAYYPFSGNANNAVGNSLHGTVRGNIQLTEDRFGNKDQAYLFNGSNTAVIINDEGALSTPSFSICYYFKTEKPGLQVIAGKINFENGFGATYNSGVFYGGNNSFFGTMQSINNCNAQVPTTFVYTITSSPVIKINEWNCVVNTFDKGYERLYLNGVLVKEEMLPFDEATYCTNTNLIIGSWWKGDPNWFKGVIDDVRFYNRAITPEEVRSICLPQQDSLIINSYSKVESLTTCDNSLLLTDASAFETGDTVLLIQMNGATIDTTNTQSFGKVLDYNHAGNYEINIISQKNGNELVLKYKTEKEYNNGAVQIVRVPYYENFNFEKPLTCQPWDGETGGVLIFMANKVEMKADIDVSGKGFRSGKPLHLSDNLKDQTAYFYGPYSNAGAQKGEGIATFSPLKNYGRGAAANGGGGGNSHNGGGGGGANGGNGGIGGRQFEDFPFGTNIGGLGGYAIPNSGRHSKLFMGGAGGMGQANNGQEYKAGNGGGIVIIIANQLQSNGHTIKANGENGENPTEPDFSIDGGSGGGAGGTIFLDIPAHDQKTKATANGGKGADNLAYRRHAPGGGGGGGAIIIAAGNFEDYDFEVNGGKPGIQTGFSPDTWGAEAGTTGPMIGSIKPVIASKPVLKLLESVAISQSVTDCNVFTYTGEAVTLEPADLKWFWEFSDGKTANGQKVTYTHHSDRQFTTKLIVEDANGCTVSDFIDSKPLALVLKAPEKVEGCKGSEVSLLVEGADVYSWAPATGLSDPSAANPVATISNSVVYTVTGKNSTGCTGTATIEINQLEAPKLTLVDDVTICTGASVALSASGVGSFSWTPQSTLNNPSVAAPVASPAQTTQYKVTLTGLNSCITTDSVLVTVRERSLFTILADTVVCAGDHIELAASGGTAYSWSSSALIPDPQMQNPIVTVNQTATFTVEVFDAVCNETQTLSATVTALPLPNITAKSANEITCSQPSSRLLANGGENYIWYPDEGLSSATAQNPVATILESKNYTVTGTDINGCSNSATIEVKVSTIPDVLYELPNSFTPNGDGLNDCFGVAHWGFLESLEFQVFNRWGQRVFHTTQPGNCWDGRFKGDMQPSGAFMYIIKATTACGNIERKGTLFLLR